MDKARVWVYYAFEGWVIGLAKHLPVDTMAQHVEEYDTRLWRVIHHYTEKARATDDQLEATMTGIDETSKKGHNYISVVAALYMVRNGNTFTIEVNIYPSQCTYFTFSRTS